MNDSDLYRRPVRTIASGVFVGLMLFGLIVAAFGVMFGGLSAFGG